MPSKSLVSLLLIGALLGGCAKHHDDDRSVEQQLNNNGNGGRYTSAAVSGQTSKINLDAVKKAFWDTQGGDMDTAMKNFEQRVNEIYTGDEVVSIDAAKQGTGVMVVGFIDKNNQPGFQEGDERLFVIEQTGQAANNQIPYRMSTGDGHPYYEGHHDYHDHSGFWTGLIVGSILWGPYGHHYYTPYSHYHTITTYRTVYRGTPAYRTQVASNRSFNTRFRSSAPGGGVSSNRRFGSGGFSGGSSGTSSSRRWGGPSGSSGGSSASTGSKPSSTSSWSNRRSTSGSSTSSTGSSGRSWGSSSSSSSGSSWSSRRSSSSSSSSRRRR